MEPEMNLDTRFNDTMMWRSIADRAGMMVNGFIYIENPRSRGWK
jgi:hypothetical protein